jgi:vacuolar-type H+-ATPase subunit F/Vma7
MKIIAMGSAVLMDGFALSGIKTYADETAEVVNTVLGELHRNREPALVFIQQNLFDAKIPMIEQLRNRGGSILICEIPDLQGVQDYQPEVETLIRRVLGSSALESPVK